MNVPPAEPTVMDLAPLGNKVTVPNPEPPLTVPEKATSLAVMVTEVTKLEMEVEAALVTLPVPSVVMAILPPVALALRVMSPLEPEEVCSIKDD